MKTQTTFGKEASNFMTTNNIGHDVSDGRYIAKGAYVLDETANGLPLQLNGKRVGTARNLGELQAFFKQVLGAAPSVAPAPKAKVKDVFLPKTVQTESNEPASVYQRVYSWAVGILNQQDFSTKVSLKEAIALADPERKERRLGKTPSAEQDATFEAYRAKRLTDLGAKWQDISVEEHVRRRTLYYKHRNALVAEFQRTGSLGNTIYNILAEYTE